MESYVDLMSEDKRFINQRIEEINSINLKIQQMNNLDEISLFLIIKPDFIRKLNFLCSYIINNIIQTQLFKSYNEFTKSSFSLLKTNFLW